jgi:predicted phosphodiesterase
MAHWLWLRSRIGHAPVLGWLLLAVLVSVRAGAAPDSFRFAILGDRTGEAQPGVYEQAWKEVAAENPAFVLSVGDTIQGMDDGSAEAEWMQIRRMLEPFRRFPLYLTPGNHDIWSQDSERLFRKYTGHAPHYAFDYGPAHFTVLDNSRSDELAADELAFLEADLKAHAAQPLKIVVSHRPSWLFSVALGNSNFALHQIARRYGVQYVIAGHVHQMLHLSLDGVTYVSMPSSGGHLRLSGAYADGWFFAHALVAVHGRSMDFQIEELGPPRGEGRVSTLADWGMMGLIERKAQPQGAGVTFKSVK